MVNKDACAWLLAQGTAPIRYRVAREFLSLPEDDLLPLREALLRQEDTRYWLNCLKPGMTPPHPNIHHGMFDHVLENAMAKVVQLGLHAGIPALDDAASFFLRRLREVNGQGGLKRDRTRFNAILEANFLLSAGFRDDFVVSYMLGSLEEMHLFVSMGSYDLYVSQEDRHSFSGIPGGWASTPLLRPEIIDRAGFAFPLVYDLIGMSGLYDLNDETAEKKIDDVLAYIACDDFHNKVANGYGILFSGKNRYHSMGWDPKFPGWPNVSAYMQNKENGRYMSRLLFFALQLSRYPAAVRTAWYRDLLAQLEAYRTGDFTYCFPKPWLKEAQGYAVGGAHLSFGENRKNKNWCAIESTFLMQLLKKPL